MYLTHEQLRSDALEARDYQTHIATSAEHTSTLVVLPTGMGKTIIALLLIAHHLKDPANKILFLSPTKPLVSQHTTFLKTYLLNPDTVTMFTGEITPDERLTLWQHHRIIVSTPQVIENDLIAKRLDLKDVSLIIYDESHRAVGNYSYVFIADTYHRQRTHRLSLGMTASPGNDLTKILEVCHNLEIQNIEIRTPEDPDVHPYVHALDIQFKEIPLPPEFASILLLLRKALATRLHALNTLNLGEHLSTTTVNRKKLLNIQTQIQQRLRSTPTPPHQLYTAASTQNAALKIYHAIELLQTQGVTALRNYFQRILQDAATKGGSKAARDIVKDPDILDALAATNTMTIDHPKIPEITTIIRTQFQNTPTSKIIVFTHYRDTANLMVKHLQTIPGVQPVRFVGQAGKGEDKGLTQKEQIDIIKHFQSGDYNVLIATSVAEEGLDIPSTDLVIFYEPVPSEIRTIQRRGRTARKMPGKAIILIAKDTPDEAYYWTAKHKEKQMHTELETLRASLHRHHMTSIKPTLPPLIKDQQATLTDYQTSPQPTIIVDYRESRSPVIRHLASTNINVQVQDLDVGDYIVSQRIGIERKTADDFLASLLEGKLFTQIKNLRQTFSRPILIIEGEGLLTKRNITHAALFGSLASILIDFGVGILTTDTPQETADLLAAIAKREQRDTTKPVAIRGEKWATTPTEQQQFIIESLPNISVVLAKRLLEHFGSIRAIINASVEDLSEIHGIGIQTAKELHTLFAREYTSS